MRNKKYYSAIQFFWSLQGIRKLVKKSGGSKNRGEIMKVF